MRKCKRLGSKTKNMNAEQRFHISSEEELELLVENRHSKATKSVFKVAENLIYQYTLIDTEYSLEELCDKDVVSVCQLDKYLSKFFANARKQDGEKYSKKSMITIRFGIQKLFMKRREEDIINHPDFKKSKETFKAVLVNLKQEGKAETRHKDVISEADLKKLYNSDAFDLNSPETLQFKVFFDYMLHFCNRGRENLRSLKKSDFTFCADSSGRRYITVISKMTKNRREDDDDHSGSNRIYEDEGNPRCPVVAFGKYLNKLHPECDDFFQRPLTKTPTAEDSPWYAKQPLGHNKLGSMMCRLSEKANLSRLYTNHCVRATCITLLDNNGFEGRHIMGISKHKSESSLKHYSSRLSEQKRLEASNILMKACRSDSANKDSMNSVLKGKTLETINSTDIQEDPVLSQFLSQSEEDFVLADIENIPDVIPLNNFSATMNNNMQKYNATNQNTFSTTTGTNLGLIPVQQNTVPLMNSVLTNDASLNVGLYAPSQQNVVPFNLYNYGNVYINSK